MSFLFYFYIFIYFYFYFLFFNLYFNIPLSCIIWSGVLCNDLSNIWFYLDQSTPEVHANAAETLCAITRNASSALAIKLSSPRFVLWAVLFIEHMLCTCTYFIERLKSFCQYQLCCKDIWSCIGRFTFKIWPSPLALCLYFFARS